MSAPETNENGNVTLRRLLRVVELTGEQEIDCSTCLALVPGYVDRELAGVDAVRQMPDLARHLALCGDCREEYEAVRDLAALDGGHGLPDRSVLLGRLERGDLQE